MNLNERIVAILAGMSILPRRMLLDTAGVAATVPMLRGVWGAALHDLDPTIYAGVFAPNDEAPQPGMPSKGASGMSRVAPLSAAVVRCPQARPLTRRNGDAGGTAVPGYVLRPAPPDPAFAPAIEWILIGDALRHDFALCRAWDIASGMGLGPQRRRFHLRRWLALRPDGQPVEHATPWPLSDVRWLASVTESQASGEPNGICVGSPRATEVPPDRSCRLCFHAPLRLMRRGTLTAAPTLPDLVVAAARRVKTYLDSTLHPAWDDLTRQALELARNTPTTPWQGDRLDLRRYSGRQQAELELRGVSGSLGLPRGPGELWPLLAAAQWLHLGKGTVMGLGQLNVEPY